MCHVGHSQLPVGGCLGPGHPVLEEVFPWPQRVGVCRHENVLVSGLCGRGMSEPGTDGATSETEPLQTELGQLVREGGCPDPCYDSHGHPLAPLKTPGLGQGYN